jgi:hypothetical protein
MGQTWRHKVAQANAVRGQKREVAGMIEVLKQALDALETEVSIDWTNNDEFNASAEKMHDAITSLQQAIKELESQEPVAWCRYEDGMWVYYETKAWDDLQPLYTHPPQRTWQGLTDDDWKEIEDMPDTFDQGVAWAQAKLKERNL